MKRKVELDIDVPLIPNFLRTKDGRAVISIRDFTKKELEEIGKEWTKLLVKKARKK